MTAGDRPSLAGLIAVMPLTGLLVMLWVYSDSSGDPGKMKQYCLGAVFGIIPAILFFVSAYMCFRRQVGLGVTLVISFGAWVAAALVHQRFLAS